MCGADILGTSNSPLCTSCGANVEELTASQKDQDDASDRKDIDATERVPVGLGFDETPIAKSGDLELVQSGSALWADKDAADAVKPSTGTDAPTTSASKPKPAPAAAVAATDEPKRDIPTLADLARQRRERIDSETKTEPERAPIPGYARLSREDAEAEMEGLSGNSTPVDSTVRTPQPIEQSVPPVEGAPRPVPRPLLRAGGSKPVVGSSAPSSPARVALFEGNTLTIPGLQWKNGESVTISGRLYELRHKDLKHQISQKLLIVGASTFTIGCLWAWILASSLSSSEGGIVGVVRDVETGALLPGVTVAVEGKGISAETDANGMFHLNHLDGGVYRLTATDPIYGSISTPVTVTDDVASTMLDLQKPSVQPQTSQLAQSTPRAPIAPEEKPLDASASVSKAPGQLAVSASVPNARVYVDGNMVGVGNAVYDGVRPGTRTVSLVLNGYKTWERRLTIASGKLTRVEPVMTPDAGLPAYEPSSEQHASLGRDFLEKRDYKSALERLNRAIEGEERPQYYAWRADAYVGLKDLKHAEADYLKSIRLFTQSSDRARLDQLITRAVAMVPQSAGLWMAAAEYNYRRGQLEGAEAAYRQAISAGADPVKAYIGIGLTHYAGGGFDAAADMWTRADELADGADARVAGYLALAHARMQRRASCRDAVRRVVPNPKVLDEFRAHPDWGKVRQLTGEG